MITDEDYRLAAISSKKMQRINRMFSRLHYEYHGRLRALARLIEPFGMPYKKPFFPVFKDRGKF